MFQTQVQWKENAFGEIAVHPNWKQNRLTEREMTNFNTLPSDCIIPSDHISRDNNSDTYFNDNVLANKYLNIRAKEDQIAGSAMQFMNKAYEMQELKVAYAK